MPDRIFRTDLCKHYNDLQIYARSLEPDFDDAEDLVQETIYKAMRYRENYNDTLSLRGWLFTILKNTSINSFRRKKMINSLITTNESLAYDQLNYSSTKNDGEKNCMLADINRCIALLKPDYAIAIDYFLKGYKYHEIATRLDIPIGTVKFRIHAAREILKGQLRIYQLH